LRLAGKRKQPLLLKLNQKTPNRTKQHVQLKKRRREAGASDDKKTRPKKLVEFHNIKISQVSNFS